ncbi:MAG: MBL fold metallo-hydrolase [Chloroflexi bacterium]|nr:MBL fold metallo-hydrolase [Chloroflexota bacterium]
MEITWFGYSCFRLKGKEVVIITDPFGKSLGYNLGKQAADIVTVSHSHPNHSNVEGMGGKPRVLEGPGEYEIAGVFVSGIATCHDKAGGKERGKNTVYLLEIDEVTVCHLGDLGHIPSTEQVEEMTPVDVLLVPVGGGGTLGASEAMEVIGLLDPKIVIPMHYRTEDMTLELETAERFLKETGHKELSPQPRLVVSPSGLPEVTQIVLLDHRR